MNKIVSKMSDEEYDVYIQERNKLQTEIDHTSLLMREMKDDGKCPFCHNNIATRDKIREEHLQNMREYNKFVGRKYYVTHVEGDKKWEL